MKHVGAEKNKSIWMARAAVLLTVALALGGCLELEKSSSATAARYPSLSAESLVAFRQTAYRYLTKHCGECHGRSQTPLFASSDSNAAHQAAVRITNFADITLSRIVRKARDGHCGGACATDAQELVDLIAKWDELAAPTSGEEVPIGNVFTSKISIPAPPSNCTLPGGLVAGGNCWMKLKFPVKQFTPPAGPELARAWFEVDFAYESFESESTPASYVIRNPRVVTPDSEVYIFDVKIFLNGTYKPEYGAAYRQIDMVVGKTVFNGTCNVPAAPTAFDPYAIGGSCTPSTPPLFSTAASASGIIQELPKRDKEGQVIRNSDGSIAYPGPDQISFSFEYFQKGIVGDCKDLALFDQNVFGPIKQGAIACLDCHKASGAIPEAGRRFNMDPNDPVNGATANERLTTICRKFLQRSNFVLPPNSPIIVQPKQGLNGMPAQPNFNFFAPDWISWIEREAELAD